MLKLLLAEDDLDDQQLFRLFLDHRTDITILPMAENGVALFDIFVSLNSLPDFIVLDQNMPLRNGLLTLQLLKDHPQYAHIPVFLYSTYMDELLYKDALSAGALEAVTKPVTKQEYEAMIDRFIAHM